MSPPQTYLRVRTPQACDRCRRSKTKCSGNRPRCRSCSKRNVACSWPQAAVRNDFDALSPPADQETPKINQLGPRTQSHPATLEVPSLFKTTLILPEPYLLHRLFQIFFARHHEAEFCSFFHKPSLQIPTLHDKSPLLVASVISLAALYISADESEDDFGFASPSAFSDYYARLAKSYAYSLCDEPSVYTIQAYLILAIRELITWSSIKAYMFAGIALRMAQALHLGVEISECYSPRQKEIRRRTFWACFVVDRLISYSSNKPFALSFQSARIQLPCPENVFAFDEVYAGVTVEDITLQENRLSQLGIMPFFISMLRLWGEIAYLHVSGGRRRSKYAPNSSESEFSKWASAIEKFSSSLPPALSWSAQNYELHQITGQAQEYVNLNLLLHHSRCVMHQEYLPQLDSQYSLGSGLDDTTIYDAAGISLDFNDVAIVKTCVASANIITEIALTLNAGSEKDRQLLQSIFAANALLTTSAIHLWVLYTQTCDACPKLEALAKAEKLRQIIKCWQPQWRVATAWVETLEMLYKLYVYSYGKVVESDLGSWEIENDDINDNSEVIGEVLDESSGHPTSFDTDVMPDPSTVCQRLYDKIRSILVNPLLATNVKKHNLRIYCRTLWQHMWILGPTEGDGDYFLGLENIAGETRSELWDMPYLEGP